LQRVSLGGLWKFPWWALPLLDPVTSYDGF
jgi:hypothetical protein